MPPRPPPELECPCDEPPPSTDPTMPLKPPELCLLPPMTLFSRELPKLLSLSCPPMPLVPSSGAAYGFPWAGVLPGVGTSGAAIVGVSQVLCPVLI